MNILLDTNAIIWFAENDPLLSAKAKEYIESDTTMKYISIASIWEMAIKISIGKLQLNISLEELTTQFQDNGILIIPISLNSVTKLTTLPTIHKDPFDRILVCECLGNNYILVSSDVVFDNYSINRIW